VADSNRLPEHSSNALARIEELTLTDYPGFLGMSNRYNERIVIRVVIAAVLSATAAFAGQNPLPNFINVNEQILRGGQPTDEGFKKLAERGVKTVVDLRWTDEHDIPRERQVVETAGMRFVSIPMRGLSAPTQEQLSKALSVLEDSNSWPVFVHCRRGSDRTGTVLACYRIAHDHWQNQKALAEAKTYGLSSFERAMRSFIEHFQPGPVALFSVR
jgi:tyrosine-protein phosphatase SIW14